MFIIYEAVLTKLQMRRHLRVFEGGAPWASWGHDLALLRLMQVSDLYFTSYFSVYFTSYFAFLVLVLFGTSPSRHGQV